VNLDIASEKLLRLVDRNVVVEELGSGFLFTEGPVWHAQGRFLLFSDIAANTRRRWDEANGIADVASPSHMANGLTFDAEGRLLACEHVTSVVSRSDGNGSGQQREVVASHFGDKELNSPNDIVVRSDGSIYFTDPPGGRSIPGLGIERPCELDFNGVFRIPADGSEVELVSDQFVVPNGLCFTPDESGLYVNDTARSEIRLLDLRPDGSVSGGRLFADGIGQFDPERSPKEGHVVDGMKCDEQGNVWVTGPGGIWVFAADGEHLGVVRTPVSATNLHWGEPDWSTLFVTARTHLFRFRTGVAGRREPFMLRDGRS
jgi:gluconolactonase